MTSTQHEPNIVLIKDNLQSIMRQLTTAPKARPTSDIKAAVSKIHNLVLLRNEPIERFYFITLLCKLCSDEKPNKVDKLMKVILPPSPTPQSMALVSDIISFALCYSNNYGIILDNLSTYMNGSDMIKIVIESWDQAETLALNSPCFCSALLSRQDLPLMGIPKNLVAKWLQDLSKTSQNFPPVNLSQIIRFSLLESQVIPVRKSTEMYHVDKTKSQDTSDSDLHFCILTLIQSRRCLTLTNQFLIEIANALGQEVDSMHESRRHKVLDRFGQILSVAASSKATTITSSLRNALGCLQSNQLIGAVIRWQSK